MNETLFNLGFDEVGQTSSKNNYANKARKKNKTKQINKMIEKEKEIQKRIYSIKPKIT